MMSVSPISHLAGQAAPSPRQPVAHLPVFGNRADTINRPEPGNALTQLLRQLGDNNKAEVATPHNKTCAETGTCLHHTQGSLAKLQDDPNYSILSGISQKAAPLDYAVALNRKANEVGFNWTGQFELWQVLENEIAEYKEAVVDKTRYDRVDEFGDVLFTLANIGLMEGIDPTAALAQANAKFANRFQWMERTIANEMKQSGVLKSEPHNRAEWLATLNQNQIDFRQRRPELWPQAKQATLSLMA